MAGAGKAARSVGVTVSVEHLLARWRAEAATFHQRGQQHLARMAESFAEELETALTEDALEVITLEQAEQVSGYSRAHLRRLISEQRLKNVGRKHAPRVRRGDLPRKPDPPLTDGPDMVGDIRFSGLA